MNLTPNRRMALIALVVLVLDQITKQTVVKYLGREDEIVIIDGFFKFVNWSNTGAAWSMFSDQNALLGIISLIALLLLFLFRHHFDAKSMMGQVSLGLLFGGITGNLIDRLFVHHVIDFLRFYVYTRSGNEIGFPAFNIADSAICVGVGLLFVLSWKQVPEMEEKKSES